MRAFRGIKRKIYQVSLKDAAGQKLFDGEVEFPDYFDYNDALIVASRYLLNSAKQRESSFFQLVERVSKTIASWAAKLLAWNEEQESSFAEKLAWYQVHRYLAFNSPVYFNVGLPGSQICHACHILDIGDTLESIYQHLYNEMQIFRYGAGSGINLSKLRSSKERVSGGGFASGPVSFLKTQDISAATVKSGGRLRRAAKLARLDVTHPDIVEFIESKAKQEEKARLLVKGKLINDPIGEIPLQATNISVGVTDDFMEAVKGDKEIALIGVKEKDLRIPIKARDLWNMIVKAAWDCGDPGLQFHDTINRYNPTRYEITCSNPCGEYFGNTLTSCNLASINILQFVNEKTREFDIDKFRDAVETLTIALTAISYFADYPLPELQRGSHRFHNIGIGLTNLGAFLLFYRIPYDSKLAAVLVENIYAFMKVVASLKSQEIAKMVSPYSEYSERHSEVYQIYKDRALDLKPLTNIHTLNNLHQITVDLWTSFDPDIPMANSQVLVQAPTGTISFMMGAETTGIEPYYSLVVYKKLMDGATIPLIPKVLLNFLKEHIGDSGIEYVLKNGVLPKDTPKEVKDIIRVAVSDDHEIVADNFNRIDIASAAQKFISSGISITYNLPNSASVSDVEKIYWQAYEKGLKGVTVFRDGCKAIQVLYTKCEKKRVPPKAVRVPLSDRRKAEIKKFRVGQAKGYLITGEYDDGSLGEIFIKIAKEGSTLSGLVDAFATIFSIALQHGVPLQVFVEKLKGSRFEPSGFTGEDVIKSATSIIDYIVKYLELKYLSNGSKKCLDTTSTYSMMCPKCGGEMLKQGSCFVCQQCGESSGVCE